MYHYRGRSKLRWRLADVEELFGREIGSPSREDITKIEEIVLSKPKAYIGPDSSYMNVVNKDKEKAGKYKSKSS